MVKISVFNQVLIILAKRNLQKRGKTMGKRSFWQSLRNNRWLMSTGMLAAGALAVYGVWQIPSLNQYHMETLESPTTDGGQKENIGNTDTNNNTQENNQGNSGFNLPRDEDNKEIENQEEKEETQQEEQNKEEDTSKQGTTQQELEQNKEDNDNSQETAENTIGDNELTKQSSKQKKKTKKKESEEKQKGNFVEVLSNPQSVLNEGNFDESAGLSWPIQGDVILNYDTEGVVYFQTLAQYKANPAIMIAGTTGKKVKASAAGVVTEIAKNEETGVTLKMAVGNSYEIIYGQLQDLKVCEGDQIKEGTVLGTLAEPTDYYVVEGPNLYFQILQDGTPVNPLLLLK